MFWFKKKEQVKKEEKKLKIQTIPEAFYGGRDPVIHFQQKKDGVSPVLTPDKKKYFIYGSVALFFVLFVSVSAWYYIDQAKKSKLISTNKTEEMKKTTNNEVKKDNQETEKIVAVSNTPNDNVIVPTAESIPTTTPSLQETNVLVFSDVNLPKYVDTDADSLSDLEEELMGVDPGKWDTDGDGYYDGQEVLNLYNPKGLAPIRIVDSGLVYEYVNPVWQYRIYYPSAWQSGSVDSQSNQVLFSAPTGDFVSVQAFTKKPGETFADWFSSNAKGQIYTDLKPIKNRFEEEGLQKKDGKVAYFERGENIFVIIYHPGPSASIPYGSMMQMMVNSFRPSKSFQALPSQVILPVEGETVSSTTF